MFGVLGFATRIASFLNILGLFGSEVRRVEPSRRVLALKSELILCGMKFSLFSKDDLLDRLDRHSGDCCFTILMIFSFSPKLLLCHGILFHYTDGLY